MSVSTTARVWLTIAHGGGRWSVTEVRERLSQDNRSTIETVMHTMADRGYLEIYEPDAQYPHQRFGVTGDCQIPRGVMNWEVADAMGMQLLPGYGEAPVTKRQTVSQTLRCMFLRPRNLQQATT